MKALRTLIVAVISCSCMGVVPRPVVAQQPPVESISMTSPVYFGQQRYLRFDVKNEDPYRWLKLVSVYCRVQQSTGVEEPAWIDPTILLFGSMQPNGDTVWVPPGGTQTFTIPYYGIMTFWEISRIFQIKVSFYYGYSLDPSVNPPLTFVYGIYALRQVTVKEWWIPPPPGG